MVDEVRATASTHSTKIDKVASLSLSLSLDVATAHLGGFITIDSSTRILLDVDRRFTGEEQQHRPLVAQPPRSAMLNWPRGSAREG